MLRSFTKQEVIELAKALQEAYEQKAYITRSLHAQRLGNRRASVGIALHARFIPHQPIRGE